MERINNRIKFIVIISLVAFCISLMLVATSFAEEQTATDAPALSEATAEENTPAVNNETKFGLNISGYEGKFQCEYFDTVEDIDKKYIIDISKGIEFKTAEYDHVAVEKYSSSFDVSTLDADDRPLEKFIISPITTNENIDLFVSSVSGPDANNVVAVEYSTFDSFKIEAKLLDASRTRISGFDLTYYNQFGNPVQTQTTNSMGEAIFTFDSKENASGYFYWHDTEGKTGIFTSITKNYELDSQNENSTSGLQRTNIALSNTNFALTGNEHLTNFMITYTWCDNTDIFSNLTYVLPDFICYLPFANQYYDPTLDSFIKQDGSFVMELMLEQNDKTIMQFLPVSQPGFEVESWDINDNNYKIGDPVNISLMDLFTLIKGTVNFKGGAPGPQPEPPAPQPVVEEAGSVQTGDDTPIVGLILVASIAGLSLAIRKKYNNITW